MKIPSLPGSSVVLTFRLAPASREAGPQVGFMTSARKNNCTFMLPRRRLSQSRRSSPGARGGRQRFDKGQARKNSTTHLDVNNLHFVFVFFLLRRFLFCRFLCLILRLLSVSLRRPLAFLGARSAALSTRGPSDPFGPSSRHRPCSPEHSKNRRAALDSCNGSVADVRLAQLIKRPTCLRIAFSYRKQTKHTGWLDHSVRCISRCSGD